MLPKTGQTISYRDGDDGYYEAGWEDGERFTDNGDGTITDNATGLMWPDDANGDGGNSGNAVNFNAALDYAEALEFAGYDDWKLPNYFELSSLLDFGTLPLAINTLIANAQNKDLWTSTRDPVMVANPESWLWSQYHFLAALDFFSYNLICCRAATPGGNPTLEPEPPFPPECNTPLKRLEYTCRAQELLRYLHNVFSRWTHTGLTQDEYDNGVAASPEDGIDEDTVIPDKLKVLYPYEDGMTVPKMEAYIKDYHKPRQNAISDWFGTNRALLEDEMQKLTTWDSYIKVEDIEVEDI